MDLIYSVFGTTSLIGAIFFFFRHAIITRLSKSIGLEFDTKLEGVRSDLRASEERLRARIRERESEISALRAGALSALTNRQAALDKRRLEAVDQIWGAVTALGPARNIAANMAVFKFEVAAEVAERDPKTRKFFETLGGDFDFNKMDLSGAAKARPFLTPQVWAVYSAILAIAMHGVLRWHVLKGGLGQKDFSNREVIEKLIVSVLPHYEEHLKQFGPSAYSDLSGELEEKLLAEIRNMLAGVEGDKASVDQAAAILKLASEVQASFEA